MSIQEQRLARFEQAVIERMKESGFLEVEIRVECLTRIDDGYLDSSIDAYWHFWNAALDSVVIELPAEPALEISAEESLDMEPEDFEAMEVSHGLECMMLRKCRTAIEAAGLKVAP